MNYQAFDGGIIVKIDDCIVLKQKKTKLARSCLESTGYFGIVRGN